MKRRSKLRLLGVVLAGGQSIRMGTDKGSMEVNGKTWCEQVFETLSSADIPVVVSVNSSQKAIYSELFSPELLVQDQQEGLEGPLKGVYSVHAQYPDKDLLVLATDMIEVSGELIERLAKAYNTNRGYDFYAYSEAEFYIPTAAIYTSKGLKKAFGPLSNTKGISLQKILNSGNTFPIQISPEESVFFKNYNSRADIDFIY